VKTILIAVGALVVGIALGVIYCESTYRHLRKRLRELRAGQERRNLLRSVTRFLFVTTQICAILWVSWSYGIATYSTIVLEQPFPVEELSRQAIITLLGMSGLKVVENIFEHNEGVVFGQSRAEDDPSDEGGEEGGVG
jgi:TRAP-type C4-dicarboxylate transport system permease small subunit